MGCNNNLCSTLATHEANLIKVVYIPALNTVFFDDYLQLIIPDLNQPYILHSKSLWIDWLLLYPLEPRQALCESIGPHLADSLRWGVWICMILGED